jgi:protein translocase SecG subunit
MGYAFFAGVVFLIASALALSAVVLVQKGRGAGWLLGSPGRGSLVGPRAAVSALFWVTAIAFGLFLALAIVLNRMTG